MGRRRGFFAELQHQNRLAERARVREQKQAAREYNAAMREIERARKAEERAQKQLERATAAELKQAEKAAKLAHIESMEAEVTSLNSRLAFTYQEVDQILAATLEVDDFVDLELLRDNTANAVYTNPELQTPTPLPKHIEDPPRPKGTMPVKPTGIGGIFGGGKYKKKVEAAENELRAKLRVWNDVVDENGHQRALADQDYRDRENDRLRQLDTAEREHREGCAHSAARIDELIAGLGYGTPESVHDYVSIVLSNSVYPEVLHVEHEFHFDVENAELALKVFVSPPDQLPSTKAYKYTKSTDLISETSLSQKACKDRYSSIIQQIALRSLHEVFEADRRGIIKTMSLEVGTETTEPATGLEKFILFVATAAERDEFLTYNLSAVDPAATLAHLGASISKNPYGLVSTNSKGVRR